MARHITTISGNLTHDPFFEQTRNTKADLCKLRLASSRRVRATSTRKLNYNETAPDGVKTFTHEGETWVEEDTWTDVDTLYLDVECWGELAVNVKACLFRGAPVTVTGQLVTDQWEVTDDQGNTITRSKIKMRATEVAFDLSRHQIASAKTAGTTHAPEGMEAPKIQSAEDLLAKQLKEAQGDASTSDYFAEAEAVSV
ncbi:single-stranded DNA-binding protein [Corynebacterium cystitidis]|uniref:Single-stranded DNA-binding protein n=1 Tax=Corynebacterium cystitidis DSM 20524 TaxID=1121357 RepID=A0A1H9SM26_9CORY|nr:single-stranded DNA-binding protein [Corynebacterium cystitidis]WJY83097.1 hypothetical protein CCYS_11000 [Corynebacterium cystitidis DSM 20524]SER85974.1 single-strand DNA-binding protein [Corynebacterium cystitidis DSM 20524]SNV66198.1 Single-stranded DNA-binding protein [Corynebacterium cystitidis]